MIAFALTLRGSQLQMLVFWTSQGAS